MFIPQGVIRSASSAELEEWTTLRRSSARSFFTNSVGSSLCIAATGTGNGGVSWVDQNASGFQNQISGAASSATQSLVSTTGAAPGQVHFFGVSNTTRTVQTVDSATQITYTATISTTINETVALFGDTYKPAISMFYNDRPRRVTGIGVMRSLAQSAGHTISMNLSLWPNVIDGSSNWGPDTTILHASAWGTLSATNTAGSVRMYVASFQDTIDLPVGSGWVMNIYKFTGGISGSFAGVAISRPEVLLNAAAAVEGRFDGRLSTAVQYMATTPAAVMSGKTFGDNAQALTTRAENLEYWFICE